MLASALGSVRVPAVAGAFYPASPSALEAVVDAHLEEARARAGTSRKPAPKAIIVPHAGYVYSGPIAARAFVELEGARERITRVVLLGPAHRVRSRGLALPGAAKLRTPLGDVEVDLEAASSVAELAWVETNAIAHAREHSLEVELPFLQRVLPHARVVPLAVGDASPDEVATTLDVLWGGDETVIVVSSDLSHHLAYDEGRARDEDTCTRIVLLDGPLDHEHACGAGAINGLLAVARRRGLTAELLDRRSSGDTAGPRDEVVGYASFAFRERPAPGTADDPRGLARWARAALVERLGGPRAGAAKPEGAWTEELASTFVTLRFSNGELQGCIGRLDPERPLAVDVAENAFAAATLDPRSEPVALAQVDDLDVEVSVLSPLEPLAARSEAEAIAALRPGRDGVVLASKRRRATFLPVMWEVFGDARTLLHELERKAGFSAGVWRDDFRILRYTVDKSVDPAPSRKRSS